jgi:hypothetical protein
MPTFRHGATIRHEMFGQGFPILTCAPAGLQSTIDVEPAGRPGESDDGVRRGASA